MGMKIRGKIALIAGAIVIGAGPLGAAPVNLHQTFGGWSMAKFLYGCAASINAPDGTNIGVHGRPDQRLTFMVSNAQWQWVKWRENYAIVLQFTSNDDKTRQIPIVAEGYRAGSPGLIIRMPKEFSEESLSSARTMKISLREHEIGTYQLREPQVMLTSLKECVDDVHPDRLAPD